MDTSTNRKAFFKVSSYITILAIFLMPFWKFLGAKRMAAFSTWAVNRESPASAVARGMHPYIPKIHDWMFKRLTEDNFSIYIVDDKNYPFRVDKPSDWITTLARPRWTYRHEGQTLNGVPTYVSTFAQAIQSAYMTRYGVAETTIAFDRGIEFIIAAERKNQS